MQRYHDFQPTGFDCKGLALPDQQDWLVVPVARNRDSGCLDESNFAVALKCLGGESDTVQVHRFGHWANGWFEIIIVQPGTPAAKEAESIEASLSDYPVLDDSDFSDREYAYAETVWSNMRLRDRVEMAPKYGYHVMASRRDVLPQCDKFSELVSYLAE
jgi:hypothetical protein